MANEKRLIDGNKLRGLKYEKVKFSDYREGWNDAIDTILTEVFSPAVEAVEVVHGRWVMTLYTTTSKRGRVIANKKFACSVCGYGNGRKQSNYCPNCGAKMDGDGNG